MLISAQEPQQSNTSVQVCGRQDEGCQRSREGSLAAVVDVELLFGVCDKVVFHLSRTRFDRDDALGFGHATGRARVAHHFDISRLDQRNLLGIFTVQLIFETYLHYGAHPVKTCAQVESE